MEDRWAPSAGRFAGDEVADASVKLTSFRPTLLVGSLLTYSMTFSSCCTTAPTLAACKQSWST